MHSADLMSRTKTAFNQFDDAGHEAFVFFQQDSCGPPRRHSYRVNQFGLAAVDVYKDQAAHGIGEASRQLFVITVTKLRDSVGYAVGLGRAGNLLAPSGWTQR